MLTFTAHMTVCTNMYGTNLAQWLIYMLTPLHLTHFALDAVTITWTDIVGVAVGWSQLLCLSYSVNRFDKFAGVNNHISPIRE